jgi:hypothetical protein
MPDRAASKRPSSCRHASASGSGGRRKRRASLIVAALAGIVAGGLADNADAQGTDHLRISVSATIVARPGSQASLEIDIIPPDALPTKSFVSLHGLPEAVSLTDGHAIGAGAWTVPVTAVGVLKANIPDNLSGRSEIVIRLISREGLLLATANTALVIEPAAIVPPAEPIVQPPPATVPLVLTPSTPLAGARTEEATADRPQPAPSQPAREAATEPPSPGLSLEERRLAEKLVAQGERYLAQADVVSARLLFRRAAEGGFALGAIRLAATYDPAELSRLRIEGVAADEGEARKWYEHARALGAPEAEEHLARLGAR